MQLTRFAIFVGLGLSALLTVGCGNGSGGGGGGGGGSPAPTGSNVAGAHGETGGACGREEVILSNLSPDGVCNLLKSDSQVNCETNFGRATSVKLSARIFLRGLKDASGNVTQIQVLTADPGSSGPASKSIVALELSDGVKPYNIYGVPLRSISTNQVNNGRVELEFADDLSSIRLSGQYTAADASGNGSITSGTVYGRALGSNPATMTNYRAIGSFSIKSCGIYKTVQ